MLWDIQWKNKFNTIIEDIIANEVKKQLKQSSFSKIVVLLDSHHDLTHIVKNVVSFEELEHQPKEVDDESR